MTVILPRRQFLAGLATLMAAPAIVRIDSLMKLARPEPDPLWFELSNQSLPGGGFRLETPFFQMLKAGDTVYFGENVQGTVVAKIVRRAGRINPIYRDQT